MDTDLDYQTTLATYGLEAEENLSTIEEGLLDLESRPRLDPELLYSLMRAAHTLKGNSTILGLQDLTDVTHVLEDCFERLRIGELAVTDDAITRLLGAVDRLRRMVRVAVAGTPEENGDRDRLVSLLEAVRDGRSDPDQAEADSDSGRGQSRDRMSVSTLRVDLTRLDKLLNLAGEIYIGQGQLNRLLEDAAARDATLAGAIWQLDQLHTEIQDEVMRLRMVPLGPTFRHYRRTLRDLARAAGKQAVLVTEGDEVEVDTAIVDRIRDPITHMLRNAIDHGLETPEERAEAGKNPTGRISLRARHSSGGVTIEVSDDGRGLDRTRIRARAVALGAIAEGAELTDAEMLHLVFTPGFSTASAVTELSGRGVGMDVVRRDIEALRGTVRVDSIPGAGTTIVLRLPLTVAIIHGFVVAVGEERYVIPLDAVEECTAFQVRSQSQDCQPGVLNLRGAPLSYIHLRDSFGLPGVPASRSSVVVVRHEDHRIGIVVDELLGERQAVIRPLTESIRQVEGFSGSTILDSGRVALILNVPNLVARAGAGAPLGSSEMELAVTP